MPNKIILSLVLVAMLVTAAADAMAGTGQKDDASQIDDRPDPFGGVGLGSGR